MWAALGVRADLISTMPVGVYRMVGGVEVQNTFTPQILINPGGEHVGIAEWMYSSQIDLDRAGNSFGLITGRDGNGMPLRIELQPINSCSVIIKDGQLDGYRIGGKIYPTDQVWHEKQYTIGGLHVGLSPVAYAAWSVGEYLSVQQFAIDWFAGGAVPRARLKNVAKTLNPREATIVKEAWKASIAAGEPFVHGNDWEYDMISADLGVRRLDRRQEVLHHRHRPVLPRPRRHDRRDADRDDEQHPLRQHHPGEPAVPDIASAAGDCPPRDRPVATCC